VNLPPPYPCIRAAYRLAISSAPVCLVVSVLFRLNERPINASFAPSVAACRTRSNHITGERAVPIAALSCSRRSKPPDSLERTSLALLARWLLTELNKLESHRSVVTRCYLSLCKVSGYSLWDTKAVWVYTSLGRSCAVAPLLPYQD